MFPPRPLLSRAAATLALTGALLTGAGLARADDGAALYAENCRKCHGSAGDARTVRGYLYFAQDFTRADWQAKRSDADILHAIREGPGRWSAMPAYGKRLDDAEQRALLAVVRGFAKAGR